MQQTSPQREEVPFVDRLALLNALSPAHTSSLSSVIRRDTRVFVMQVHVIDLRMLLATRILMIDVDDVAYIDVRRAS